MYEINLTKKEIQELIQYHKECREKKNAYRINVIILLAKKYSHSEIADALLIDEKSIQRYKKIFLEQGVDGLLVDNYKGSQGYLDENQMAKLQKHLEENMYLQSKDILHLNLIERLWHFMKKETMYNKYYENFKYFHSAIFKF